MPSKVVKSGALPPPCTQLGFQSPPSVPNLPLYIDEKKRRGAKKPEKTNPRGGAGKRGTPSLAAHLGSRRARTPPAGLGPTPQIAPPSLFQGDSTEAHGHTQLALSLTDWLKTDLIKPKDRYLGCGPEYNIRQVIKVGGGRGGVPFSQHQD